MAYALFREKIPEDPEKPFFIFEETDVDLEIYEKMANAGHSLSGKEYLHKKPLSKDELKKEIETRKRVEKKSLEYAEERVESRREWFEEQMKIYKKLEEALEMDI